MDVTLVVFKPDGTRVDVPLQSGTYPVGRSTSCRLRLPLASVSRRHCELIVDDEGPRVRDTHSSNGTFRNHVRLTPGDEVPLEAGDALAVGACMMRVQIDGQPEDVTRPDPPEKRSAPPATGGPPASAGPGPDTRPFDGEDTEDLDETLAKELASFSNDNAGSSEFDFDFDFEDDDENPKL